ncbi:MAG: hypothetical protein ABI718_10560 [Acidobacteriota bacterium]
MKQLFPVLAVVSLVLAPAAVLRGQDVDVTKVRDDARVIKRIAEVAVKDLPRDVMTRIVNEDIDTLRGKRSDSTYRFAHYGREEAGRKSDGFTVSASGETTALTLKGEFVYALRIEIPSRRFVVRKNQRTWIDRVELDITPVEGTRTRYDAIPIGQWMDPGTNRMVELPDIARDARITVYAKTEKSGPASVQLALLEAKVQDDPSSPYARAVENEKLILSNLKKGDQSNLTTVANLIMQDPALAGTYASSYGTITTETISRPMNGPGYASPANRAGSTQDVSPQDGEMYGELQAIEDLLTGTDSERRHGLDRLHQLVRRLRVAR